MKNISQEKYKAENISFDVSDMSKEELRQLFGDLNRSALQHWMQHYINIEKYEVCQVLKEIMDGMKIKAAG